MIMLNTVVSSDFATLINDLTLLDRFINSQIHEFSHTFILMDCTSQMDRVWGFHLSCTYCIVPIMTV